MILRRWWPLLLLVLAAPARGQMLHLDPLPFQAPADSLSRLALVVSLERTGDSRTDWTVNRALLTALLPAGEQAVAYVRISHASFDTRDIPVLDRWPWVAGPDAEEGWPGEARVSGYGKIEAGIVGPLKLPGLGAMEAAAALGLPTGNDRLYPVSSQSLPLRLAVRKSLDLGGGLRVELQAGRLVHMGSGREFLAPLAFPGGSSYGAALAGASASRLRWRLGWDARNDEGRRSQLASAELWLPWGESGSLGLRGEAELAGTLDRFAAWRVGVAWRLDSLAHRPGRAAETSD